MAAKVSGPKLIILFSLLLILFLSFSALSDTVNYVYDNLGRPVMAISSDGTVVIYGYDYAGNVISTVRTSISNQQPVITGISPSQVFIGNEVSITLTGNNLLQTKSVTTDNSGIQIKNFSSSNNSISIDAQIQKNAASGAANFTVQTLSGSASISMNLLSLTFTPSQVAMLNGTSTSITARIDGLASDYNLILTNNNPSVIQAPQSLTVPVAGSASFVINAVSMGAGAIASGNSGISVYVTPSYSGTTTLEVKPVSVKLPSLTQNTSSAPVYAPPVSVNNLSSGPNTAIAPVYTSPVSVNSLYQGSGTSSDSVYASPVSTAISNSGGQ